MAKKRKLNPYASGDDTWKLTRGSLHAFRPCGFDGQIVEELDNKDTATLISSKLASRNAATGHCAPSYSECPI